MSQFAKLFEFEDLGQVLVKLDDGDEGPEVRTYFLPDGFGVCSIAVTFKPDEQDDSWAKAEKAFVMIDQDKARILVVEALAKIPTGLSA
ncbi:hypothetical protein Q7C30_004360 [Pseudomonas sp. RAC1]|uniref:hypothetical protein n=1 Tax=Pseudomonas sp. RAC1 TaxID=3064900 RepID=UPI00271BD647|nr:hypothetical protein [Pseudomonas sp. RAC1]MDV9031339.1 hypothetical protein [Pseudomonas sp. RAC1]